MSHDEIMNDIQSPQENKRLDLVNVVRCRNCKFWDRYPSSTAAPDYHHCGFGINVNWHTRADEYCSRGERRDE